jgi:VanZ family protein
MFWRGMTLAWAGLIFYLSTGSFGGSFSAWVLHQILSLLRISVSSSSFDTLHFSFRKLAHLTEYFFLSAFLYESFEGSHQVAWSRRAAALSVLGAALYSLADEFHQFYVPGRTSSLIDCGIDTVGAALGTLVIFGSTRLSQLTSRRAGAKAEG